jgi:glycosyltransferase XagB
VSILEGLLILFSFAMTGQALYTVYMMIYTWDQPEAYKAARAPETFSEPSKSFTVLLPARHEELVIQQTIDRVVRARYPHRLMEVVVICESGDAGTIAKAQEKIDELARQGITNVRLAIFNDRPINKPHGLNVGFNQTQNEVVTIFDAEDEIHPDIFNIVNTVMVESGVRVIQAGVQLMNYNSSWFSSLNVLEYFFWFKSRLHYHAKVGMIPLGGNTVFFARELMTELGGWDETNLTEDADVGIRISVMREKVRIIYDDRYVTKEETPPNAAGFIKQRTRWCQGYLQTLKKGNWRRLPTFEQRVLALYTLGFPTFQALLAFYVPVSLIMMLGIKFPVIITMFLVIPAYLLAAHFALSVIGLYEFTAAHGMKPKLRAPFMMALSYMPYQWMLGYAAIRASVRNMRGINTWEKTAHVGAHRGKVPEQRAKA